MKFLPLLLIIACSGNKESGSGTTSGDDSGTTNTTKTDDSGASAKDRPVIVSIDSPTCNTFTGSDPPEDSWSFLLTVDDPQGSDTVRSGTADVKKGDKLIGTLQITCRNGTCIVSSRSSQDGITCDLEGTFNFVVTDTDGNSSAVKVYDTSK